MNLILSPSGLHVAAREHPTLTVEEIECLLRRQDLQEWLGLRNMVAELEAATTHTRRREVLGHYSQVTGKSLVTLRRWVRNWERGTPIFPAGDPRTLLDTRAVRDLWKVNAETVEPLPANVPEFVQHWRGLVRKHRRSTAAAWRELEREWKSGATVPGYGSWMEWWTALHGGDLPPACPRLPRGWSEKNLRRLLDADPTEPLQQALARQGTAAARKLAPSVISERPQRFLERVSFDDVMLDLRVLDTESGQVCRPVILVAFDDCSGMHLGYGLRLMAKRADGARDYIKADDMQQLTAYTLWRWGVPPYGSEWVLENGTATLPEGVAKGLMLAVGEDLLRVRYASMVGGKSGAGYRESETGNSNAKARLEASNLAIHTYLDDLPGYIGRRYDITPADTEAREKEAVNIWKLAQHLPAHLRGQAQYPLITMEQLRGLLDERFAQMANRTGHQMQGFERIEEWSTDGKHWHPLAAFPDDEPERFERRSRWESPKERAMRAVAPYAAQWRRAPAWALASLLRDSQRMATVSEAGEIEFQYQLRKYTFAPPAPEYRLRPKLRVLVHTDRVYLKFAYLLDESGRVLGCWPRREAVRAGDGDALRAAIEYSRGMVADARAKVHEDTAGQRAELEAMRAHNAGLLGLVADSDRLPVRDLGRPVAGLTDTTPAPAANAVARARAREETDRATAATARAERAAGPTLAQTAALADSADAVRAMFQD